MKHGAKVAIGLAGALVWHTGALAVTGDSPGNPYAGIVDRNVFALKPKPEAPVVDTTPVVPPQKIILQGIVKAWGKKQVLFKTLMPAKPGEAPKETSFMLSEGERAGEIEILEINEVGGTVKVRNHNIEQPLSLEKDGMKPTAGPGAVPGAPPGLPVMPGIPGIPGGPRNTGIQAPGGSAVNAFGGGVPVPVQRPLRVAPTTASGYPAAAAVPAGVPAHNVNWPPERPMTTEEQVVLMEIQRKRTAGQGGPPLPPTPFTPK